MVRAAARCHSPNLLPHAPCKVMTFINNNKYPVFELKLFSKLTSPMQTGDRYTLIIRSQIYLSLFYAKEGRRGSFLFTFTLKENLVEKSK